MPKNKPLPLRYPEEITSELPKVGGRAAEILADENGQRLISARPPGKKPSRARGRRLARDGAVRPASGRPKGVSRQRQELQLQLHRDLAWLGLPYKQNLYSFLVERLRDPDWRKEYGLTPPECPRAYGKSERHFRREIAFVHKEIWGNKGKKESRSLWQHWRHQDYRLTQKGTAVAAGNCRRCIRGGVYVGPCCCLAREIGRQGRQDRRDRKCMCCGNAFLSEGNRNRLCLRCRRRGLPQYA
jgi:hypothetical protein